MKTVPFSDILASVCQLVGLDRGTLNDKSFSTIRDLTSRRLSGVWDREDWPDTERFFSTFAGNPITAVEISGEAILMENGSIMLMENGTEIFTDAEYAGVMQVKLRLETTDFPRIYLSEFSDDAYKKNTIGSTYVSISNPFYVTTVSGEKVSVGSKTYNFTYNYLSDEFGDYITDIDIIVDNGSVSYGTYKGPNHPLTSKLVFNSNLNLIVLLQDTQLQGLEAYTADPRNTTRVTTERFIVEDFNDKNDIAVGGTAKTQDFSFLRFFSDSQKYISYRKPCPRFYGIGYSPSFAYSIGAQVFYDPYQNSSAYNPPSRSVVTKGDFWVANVAAGLGVAPTNTSANWSILEIPYRFRDFLINGASADFLRSEGRAEEANIFDNLAEAAIQQQIDVLVRQQGQVRRMDMVYTY